MAGRIPCGADVDRVRRSGPPFAEAGYTDLALVQIGGAPEQQEPFFAAAQREILPALPEAFR